MRSSVLMLLTVAVLAGCGPASDAGTSAPSPSAPPTGCASVETFDDVPALHPSVDGYPTGAVVLSAVDGACRFEMAVLVAGTPERRAHGLMEVPALPAGTGMLFVYPDVAGDRTSGYWMKDTLVPLDIAYIAADGTVVDVRQMDPCDETTLAAGERCPSYPPDAPYRATLEVPQGWFATIGLEPGWRIRRAGPAAETAF